MLVEGLRPTSIAELDVPAVSVRYDSNAVLASIREHNHTLGMWTLVLDDDPTGSQTIKDVPILGAHPSEDDLEWASRHPSRMTFVLTNSRAVDAATAKRLTYDSVVAAAKTAVRRGLRLRVLSRSDSTLRGHFATEILAVHGALAVAEVPAHGTVFVPAFLESGRITARDTQWVSVDGGFIPAAMTEFAADQTFGYTETNLIAWTDKQLEPHPRMPTTSISLESLRSRDGVRSVADTLQSLGAAQIAVANAVRAEDLEVLMLGLAEAEREGRNIVVRCGPSVVRVCAGQEEAAPITADDLPGAGGHGLIAVGSHTNLTNSQVEKAVADHRLTVVELDAAEVLDDVERAEREIERAAAEVIKALRASDVLLRTSREVIHVGRETPLEVSVTIGKALVRSVKDILDVTPLSFLIAKGGITSSDVAHDALGFRKALVRGQMLPGKVPVWEVVEGRRTGLPFVIFPGNVGSTDALSAVIGKVSRG